MLSAKLILLPVLVQMMLTLYLYWLVGRRRVDAVKSGEVAISDIAVETTAYPLSVRLIQNNLKNQFEMPVLFYVVSLFVFASGAVAWWEMVLACVFAATRLVHCRVHITTNRLAHRYNAFVLGWSVMIVYMIASAIRIMMLD